jgi:hypothetical protein
MNLFNLSILKAVRQTIIRELEEADIRNQKREDDYYNLCECVDILAKIIKKETVTVELAK